MCVATATNSLTINMRDNSYTFADKICDYTFEFADKHVTTTTNSLTKKNV